MTLSPSATVGPSPQARAVSRDPTRDGGRTAALVMVLAFTLASMFGFNPYQYGVSDTSISIPFTKVAADPSLYPGDYLIAQRPYYYTYLWDALGWIHAGTGVRL